MSLTYGKEEKLYLIEIIKYFNHRKDFTDPWWARFSKEPSGDLYIERFISAALAKELMDIVESPIGYSKSMALLVKFDEYFSGKILEVSQYSK